MTDKQEEEEEEGENVESIIMRKFAFSDSDYFSSDRHCCKQVVKDVRTLCEIAEKLIYLPITARHIGEGPACKR